MAIQNSSTAQKIQMTRSVWISHSHMLFLSFSYSFTACCRCV